METTALGAAIAAGNAVGVWDLDRVASVEKDCERRSVMFVAYSAYLLYSQSLTHSPLQVLASDGPRTERVRLRHVEKGHREVTGLVVYRGRVKKERKSSCLKE